MYRDRFRDRMDRKSRFESSGERIASLKKEQNPGSKQWKGGVCSFQGFSVVLMMMFVPLKAWGWQLRASWELDRQSSTASKKEENEVEGLERGQKR